MPFLVEIFDLDKTACECFMNDEYTYSGKNWNDGTKWLVSLAESIKHTTVLNEINGEKIFNFFLLIYFLNIIIHELLFDHL